jgi:ubiquinol-cytochrome c reductase iron-sulfur subunit
MSEKVKDPQRRLLLQLTSAVGAVGAGFAAVPFVASMAPSARAKAAGAPVEVDISRLEPGKFAVEEWRGKPIWILRRTPEMLKGLEEVKPQLVDPDSKVASQQPAYAQNPTRSIKPEFLVVIGLCTHLGCSPKRADAGVNSNFGLGQDWKGGFFCPCHGSKFDLAGRVYKDVPAPRNLEVPKHSYTADGHIVIGVDPQDKNKKGAA